MRKHEEEKKKKKEMKLKEKEELSNKILGIIKENNIKINNDDIFQFNINSNNESLKEFLQIIEKVDKKELKKEIIEKCRNIFGMKFNDEKRDNIISINIIDDRFDYINNFIDELLNKKLDSRDFNLSISEMKLLIDGYVEKNTKTKNKIYTNN